MKIRRKRIRQQPKPLDLESLEPRRVLATVTLAPLQDATLFQDRPDFANGAGMAMFSGNTDLGSSRRALIAFDTSAIPDGSAINDVALHLNMSRTVAAPQTISLHRILAAWGEGSSNAEEEEGKGIEATPDSATWEYRRFNTEFWDSPGGDFDSSASASVLVGGVAEYIWSSPTMIDELQNWIDDPASNYGWLLRGNESRAATAKRFDTKEHPNPAVRPALVVDFDPPDSATVSIEGTNGDEGGDSEAVTFSFDVTISEEPLEPVTVKWESRPDTATEGEDYTGATGEITFGLGQPLTQQISIVIQGDLLNEDDERFKVVLTEVSGDALLNQFEAVGIIVNDDPLPTIDIESGETDEGDTGLTEFQLNVRLSAESSKQVLVLYRTENDTAEAPDDFQEINVGQVVFEPGETETTITVQIVGDSDDEGDEEFLVSLLNPTHAELGEDQGRVSILNDDLAVTNPWTNLNEPLDVDDNGFIVPLDALLVINALNDGKTGPLPIPPEPDGPPPPFLDVNGDGFLAPNDALRIINFLNSDGAAAATASRATWDDALLQQIAASAIVDDNDSLSQRDRRT